MYGTTSYALLEVHDGHVVLLPIYHASSTSVSSCVSQECFALKLCWESVNKPWSSRCCIIDLAMMCLDRAMMCLYALQKMDLY